MTAPRRCVCPGSYDPVTLGHLDVVRRASGLFDEVVVAVLHNPAKQGTFPVEERVALIQEDVSRLGNVVVVTSSGRLLVDLCRDVGASWIVKGLRGESDYSYELPMALMNRHLTGVETLFLAGDPRFAQVSSSLVKEVVRLGGDVSALVSPPVLDALLARLR